MKLTPGKLWKWNIEVGQTPDGSPIIETKVMGREYTNNYGRLFFRKYVDPGKHFYKKRQAYGIDAGFWKNVLSPRGFVGIFMDEAHGDLLYAPLPVWEESGILEENPGWGPQMFLPVTRMIKTDRYKAAL